MLCEHCNERESTVHLTQVVDGSVKKLHLCEDCAKEAGFDLQGPVSITDILLGMGGEEPVSAVAERSCPVCHLRRADFKKMGRLGCPACYDAFADEMVQLLKAVHRSEHHVGKVPSGASERVRTDTEIAALQKALDEAVAKENYEEAARLRDRIQVCREKAAKESKKTKTKTRNRKPGSKGKKAKS
jgi:protein arginine kinase activator